MADPVLRAGYYDHVWALKDMVQNHLLQLLCRSAEDRFGPGGHRGVEGLFRYDLLQDRHALGLVGVEGTTGEDEFAYAGRADFAEETG